MSQGITPVAGPVQEEGAEMFPDMSALHFGGPPASAAGAAASAFQPTPTPPPSSYQPSAYQPSVLPSSSSNAGPAASQYSTPTPYQQPYASPSPVPMAGPSSTSTSSGATLSKGGSSAGLGAEILHLALEPHAALTEKEITACSQLCKSANSALQFQDAKTALTYLQKCIYLLTTAQTPAK